MATDLDLLTRVRSDLLEDPAAPSPLWTSAEWLSALTEAQRRLIARTGLSAGVASFAVSASVATYLLPEDYVRMIRVAWSARDGTITPLRPVDSWGSDFARTRELRRDTPQFYQLTDLPARQLKLLPSPRWADTCVVVLPSGPSAALEAGWCAGSGRDVIVHVAGLREPDLMYRLGRLITTTDRELLDGLAEWPEAVRVREWPGGEDVFHGTNRCSEGRRHRGRAQR